MAKVNPEHYAHGYKHSHERPEKLDRKVNGPFLDEVRAAEQAAYTKSRNPVKKAAKKAAKKAVKKTAKKK